MTTSRQDPAALGTENPHPPAPSAEELEEMTPEQLARLAAKLDDVEIVHNQSKFPVKGTRAERRAERSVALWFAISLLSAAAFFGFYLFWPYRYVAPGQPGYFAYAAYTPLIGFFFGLSVLMLGIGVISYVKKFFPDEVSVQQRHGGPSDEIARKTVVAQLVGAGKDTTISRRKLIIRTAGAAAGVFGIGVVVAAIAPFIHNPWKEGKNSPMWTTGWEPTPPPADPTGPPETVYIRYDTGIPTEIALVRPEDQAAGSMMTVFPFRESERNDPEKLKAALTRSDNPVMLIRLRPGTPVIPAPGSDRNYHYGDFYAFSKICTHLGCPTSLFEAQTNRILCPCHQSQFLATEYGKPVFGPAARPLPQLPLTVNDEGYLIATGDFSGPIGPAFWELGSQFS